MGNQPISRALYSSQPNTIHHPYVAYVEVQLGDVDAAGDRLVHVRELPEARGDDRVITHTHTHAHAHTHTHTHKNRRVIHA